ncbi:PX-associated-domain-containing protein [Achaetomium macrosporum]|uniref:PX-associated-domain-containing protein n=1 Tax=Achaetomium macrosporum TaxID=79813 RepID=A0AAN7H893_9PEZI|nr:PX-associated-domain-containing protein [Achaetomium macrosporum]
MQGQHDDSASERAASRDNTAPDILTPSQLHALFDILTHHETYAEVESFKDPSTISEYGYPFAQNGPGSRSAPSYATDSVAPLLAGLLRSIVLSFPGVRDLPAEFWHVRFQGVLGKLAEAELSESYDKGALGTRKTLATAASAIHEVVSRGTLGGVHRVTNGDIHSEYDTSKAEDLVRAWEDVVQQLVYGDLVEELFACAAEKQSLEEHSPGVRAAADYILIHLATLMHYVFVLSPEGPYLLKLLENVHRLLPYSMVKQTLRIGNAATMLNGMMRLLLAKIGVGALSNWVGLTQNADDGMNLLQRVIWLVLSWDASEFRKTAGAIEKTKGGPNPSKEQLAAIRDYINKSKEEHESTRKASMQHTRSVVVTILERSDPKLLAILSGPQHTQLSEYLSALLGARDRDEIASALCRQNPDLFTQAIKDAVASFEPMIRTVHQRVDLREQVSAAEGFVTDFINTIKTKKSAPGQPGSAAEVLAPSVEDFVILLRENRHLVYNWFHQLASQCPDLKDEFCVWAKETIKVFRQSGQTPSKPESNGEISSIDKKQRTGAAGSLSSNLQELFASIPPETQSRILPAIDAHAAYLSALEDLSLTRMQRILDNMKNIAVAAPTASSAPATPAATAAPTSYLSSSYWSGRSTPRTRSPSPNPGVQAAATKRSFSGPGMYLSRWQQLLDDTVIAPATPDGPLRRGRDVKGQLTRGKTGATAGTGVDKHGWDPAALAKMVEEEEKEAGASPPDVECVVEALEKGFRALVGLVERKNVARYIG